MQYQFEYDVAPALPPGVSIDPETGNLQNLNMLPPGIVHTVRGSSHYYYLFDANDSKEQGIVTNNMLLYESDLYATEDGLAGGTEIDMKMLRYDSINPTEEWSVEVLWSGKSIPDEFYFPQQKGCCFSMGIGEWYPILSLDQRIMFVVHDISEVPNAHGVLMAVHRDLLPDLVQGPGGPDVWFDLRPEDDDQYDHFVWRRLAENTQDWLDQGNGAVLFELRRTSSGTIEFRVRGELLLDLPAAVIAGLGVAESLQISKGLYDRWQYVAVASGAADNPMDKIVRRWEDRRSNIQVRESAAEWRPVANRIQEWTRVLSEDTIGTVDETGTNDDDRGVTDSEVSRIEMWTALGMLVVGVSFSSLASAFVTFGTN